MSFVHLHTHSAYSLLDGLSSPAQLVKRAVELQMPALALTDHGTMYGVLDFYKVCKGAGIRPVLGMEAYLAARGMQDRDPKIDSRRNHILLLAENEVGYHNLVKLATAAQLQGYYYRPRIDTTLLAEHAEGLICTTGCMQGEVPVALLAGNEERARARLDFYYQLFGPERFFFELQDHSLPQLAGLNKQLLELGRHYNAKFVATADVHYARAEDAVLQDVLLCIQTNALLTDTRRMRMTGDGYHLRSAQEMQLLFGHVPGALSNTVEIAERCNVNLDTSGYHLPDFPVPAGQTVDGHLRQLCLQALPRKYPQPADGAALQARLDMELHTIERMGFAGYFLLVHDLCTYAARHGIWFNARGSAAGSLVAYLCDITLVEPLRHALVFERFLNINRGDMPDIDLDFQDDRRAEMLEYCAQRYGQERVAHIITFNTLKARNALRDVGRVMGIPLADVGRVAKLVPQIPADPYTIERALAEIPHFRQAAAEPQLVAMVDTARQLEGAFRSAGTHAAGLVISDRPLLDYLPLHRPTGASAEASPVQNTTQYETDMLKHLGMLKVDFLGLRTLTVMQRACRMIGARHGIELTLHNIPTDAPESYALLGRGEVAGVFQLESSGMRRYLTQMRPTQLEHVIAMVALYRPGPMRFIPEYIERMHGRSPLVYRHPELEPILRETYGVTVYQEQLMLAAMRLGGYSATDSDDLRVAVSKKDARKVATHRPKFVSGAVARGIPEPTAEAIFADWEEFANYAFNKSHAADYGVVAVQTAHLKAHYPLEYMTALLSAHMGDTEAKLPLYAAEALRLGIELLPPDINLSRMEFEIEARADQPAAIRFALGAIKNVGAGPVEELLRARDSGGAFNNLDDLCTRADLRLVGKRALECLAKAGALDGFGARAALLAGLDGILAASSSIFRASDAGQFHMFDMLSGPAQSRVVLPATEPASDRQMRAWEKELTGMYHGDHPLVARLGEIQGVITAYSNDLDESWHERSATLAGTIAALRPHTTAKGKPMAFAKLEDLGGTVELLIFPGTWAKVQSWLSLEQLVLVTGKVSYEGGAAKLLVDRIDRELKLVVAASDASPADEMAAGEFFAAEAVPGEMPPDEVLINSPAWDEPGPGSVADAMPVAAREAASNVEPLPARKVQPVAAALHRITVTLRPGKDITNYKQRVNRAHNVLTSFPGTDQFVIVVFEEERCFELDFGGQTTGHCAELLQQLASVVQDPADIDVQPLLL